MGMVVQSSPVRCWDSTIMSVSISFFLCVVWCAPFGLIEDNQIWSLRMSPNCELMIFVRSGSRSRRLWQTSSRVLTGLIRSDYSGTNTKLSKILLNGNNICMVSCRRFFSFPFDRLLTRSSSSQEEKARWQLPHEEPHKSVGGALKYKKILHMFCLSSLRE